ncbi:lytic transglycosylase domain-containing protein [Bradyrhizobium sp. CCGUVB1N3]|uniref:lytic transglycosylase domain-containing protein n=1 Tax=Bradyrhizobium sp. CCGUVB1N3 TaxID=2949629 RepID=UPI0020B1F3CF|nr:lytic transglycosylase domain-containing protein [Bradyrhizobium sp. CCGUVB1N3]MCP3476452.1 lytic transglycosylase domain-containing protein [Bradyrhizobium sp. CCGUVB1N3]
MQDPVTRAADKAHQGSISLFAEKPAHPFVPLKRQSAVAHSGGRGRPQAGALRAPLTDASVTLSSRDGPDRAGPAAAILLLGGLLAVGAPTPAACAQVAPTQRQPASDHYATLVAEAARRFGIPESWIRAVMRIESHGDRSAVSPKGALGLMQLMPRTWADMRARYGLGPDPFDPHDNILAGAAFLRQLHDRYGSPGFLAAYNAGPRRYEDFRDRHRPLPAETVAYVAAIVPFVDAERLPGPLLVAASSRSSWKRAPLFFDRADGPWSAARATPDRPAHDMPAAVPVHDLSAIAPQSQGLFVALQATGRSQ